jgi:hypothetical protein
MPPVTLTRGQFAQSKAGQAPGATYERYLSFVNNARKGSGGSLAPAAAPDFNTLVGVARKAIGPQMTDQQIQDYSQGAVGNEVGALGKQLTDLYGARLGNVSHAITGYTDSATHALAAIPKPDYSAAIRSRADAGAALGTFLTGQGGTAGDAVRAKLAAIGAPAESQALGQQATSGVAGQSASSLAAGNLASADRLGANQSAAEAYAASLPGLVQLAGAQNQKIAGAQNASQLQSGLADVASKAPGLALGLEQNLLSNRLANNRESLSLASSMLSNYNSNELKKAIALGGFGVDYAKLASSETQKAADRSSREAIAASNRQGAMARTIARDNTTLDRAHITSDAAAGKHLDSLTTSSFQKAASAAARMKVGTWGNNTSGMSINGTTGTVTSGAGTPYTYSQAYNAVYGQLEGPLANYVNAAGLRKLTLRALAAGGYPVTVTKGG